MSGGEDAFVFLASVFEAGGCLRSGAMLELLVILMSEVEGKRERERDLESWLQATGTITMHAELSGLTDGRVQQSHAYWVDPI